MNAPSPESKNLPGPVPDLPRPDGVVVRAVGDIALIARAAAALQQHGCQYPFEHVADLVRAADLAFGNLEMPICSDRWCEPSFPDVCPDFRCPPQTAEALEMAGFDVLNLANNHTMDWGIAGLSETLARLHGVGLQTIGAGKTLRDARQPALFVRNGLRIAFLGYGVRGPWNATPACPGTAPIERELIVEDLRAMRDEVDLLVVSLHAGILSDYPNLEDRRLARELIEQGADLVLGHGPHVLQGVEFYQGRVIAHSLGNFIIDLSSGNVQCKTATQEQQESVILDVELAHDGMSRVSYIPILISGSLQTVPASPQDAARILARLEILSNNLDRMHGLTLWQHAGMRNVEHELQVLAFQAREVGWRQVFRRLKKIRWRHMRLLLGYVVAKTRKLSARWLASRQQLPVGECHD